jgi:hypothetical protein
MHVVRRCFERLTGSARNRGISSRRSGSALGGALIVALAVGIGAPAPARAADLSFPPDADTFVSSKETTTNFGNDVELRVDGDSERITYLRFVVTGVAGRPVTRARLRLSVLDGGPVGGSVYLVTNNTWQEQTVTWATRPAVSASALHTLGALSPGMTAEFNLDAAISDDGTYNLALRTPNSDGVHFRSSRATSGAIPALVVTVSDGPTTPPPNTAPTVTITAPSGPATVTSGTTIGFSATATDVQDGNLGSTIAWSSDLQGALGQGQNVSAVLGMGHHQVTARVQDSGGLQGVASVVVDVVAPSAPTEELAFEPAADTWVSEKEPQVNMSTQTELRIDADSVRITYLRFAVTGLGGRPVLGARLLLHSLASSNNGGTVHLITNNTWQEQTVTYATRPAIDGPDLDTVGAIASGAIVEFALDAAVTGDGVYNFAIVTPSSSGAHYRSSRATSGQIPRLVLTVSAGPEPAVEITQPGDNSVFFDGDVITFQGHATDVVDGNLDADIEWSSTIDGDLGTGATIMQALSLGSHEITAFVTDSDGFNSHYVIHVTVSSPPPPNTEPLVAITAPASGQTFMQGQSVGFSGTASDLEQGSLSTSLRWTSSRDGNLGTGATITAGSLTVGTHTVTASVTDAGGLTGTATRMIVIQAASGTVGFEDFSFGSGVDQDANRVTGSKPESKLWHYDGLWWATLYNPAGGGGHRIHALDPTTQTWLNTGVLVDERKTSRQDVLWTGQKLYFASRAGSGTDNRLYRFSYDPAGPAYTLDAGFPVAIPSAFTEAMTIARDSTGKLWVAYTASKKVFVNSTNGNDTQWGTPFQIPVTGSSTGSDDISAIQALQDGKIGVFWSNQSADADYFAVHPDSAAATASWTREVAASGGKVADDHFNVKQASDGRLFVAVKTSKTGSSDTLVGLLVRSTAGAWSSLFQVTTGSFDPTRPTCLLDEQADRVYVFYSPGKSAIYHKSSSMSTISFPSGKGTPFMEGDGDINNPTTTKQNLDASTGIVVVGSAPDTLTYWHNTIGVP